MARGLLAGRTGTVGLLTSDLEGRFMIPILMGAEDAFGAGQVNVFLCDARGDAIREQHHLKALLSRRVDGIIVVGRQTDPRPSLGQDLPGSGRLRLRAVRRPARPLAHARQLRGRAARDRAPDRVRPHAASRTSPGDPDVRRGAGPRSRARGPRSTPRGSPLVGEPMFSVWSEHWGRDAAAMLLDRHPDIDAIFCGSDQIARGVLDTARDLGRAVPDDLAVIGYDNWEVLTTNSRPELTSIDANLQQLGRQAAQRVFDAIDGVDIGEGTHHPAGARCVVPRDRTIALPLRRASRSATHVVAPGVPRRVAEQPARLARSTAACRARRSRP